MNIDITTPALLFPAISLLLLAFTNRFLTIATIIRQLHSNYKTDPSNILLGQIKNLRERMNLIKQMQAIGMLSFLFCVICMLFLFWNFLETAKYFFAGSLILLIWSLVLSLKEIYISVEALDMHLSDIEEKKKN